MATPEQRRLLLATICPFCGAQPSERCAIRGRGSSSTKGQRAERPITTLDGGSHDARWRAAGLGSAPVLAARVEELQERPLVAAGSRSAPPVERPW